MLNNTSFHYTTVPPPIVLDFCELPGVITCSMQIYPIIVSELTNIPYHLKYYRYNILKLTSWSLNFVGMAGPGLIIHIFFLFWIVMLLAPPLYLIEIE